MSIAKGRDEQAEYLLQNIPTSVCIVIPSICYFESLVTLNSEEKYNQDFLNKLDIQINEAERDKTSQFAQLLVSQLKQAKISFNSRTNEIEERFYAAFYKLKSKAEEIPLTSEINRESLQRNILQKHIIDKLILECIVHHASLHPNERKIFLSSNSKEFAQQEVSEILQDIGVQYFKKTQNLIGWLQSQSS